MLIAILEQKHIISVLLTTRYNVRANWVFVTCYYQLGKKSKHKDLQYINWISRFVKIFTGELFFYTNEEHKQFYWRISGFKSNIHFITRYPWIWDIPKMGNLKGTYEEQWKIDPEKRIHSPYLYSIWNGKVNLLHEISSLYPDKVAFWIDSGMCRESIYDNISFPSDCRFREIFPDKNTGGKMVFAMYRKWRFKKTNELVYRHFDGVIGGFFGGDHAAVEEFYRKFWSIHDHFLNESRFVGKEQNLFTTYVNYYYDNVLVEPNFLVKEGCRDWWAVFDFWVEHPVCSWKGPRVLHNISDYFR